MGLTAQRIPIKFTNPIKITAGLNTSMAFKKFLASSV